MIGELDYMPIDPAQGGPRLNAISRSIVARAVALWRETPGSALVCESAPMSAEAVRLGADPADVATALPQARGHTTRLVALWMAGSACAGRRALLVTHAMHAPRSVRIFSKVGISADAVPVDLPFDRRDPDWKLRSAGIFRLYNAAAYVYCACRGWL